MEKQLSLDSLAPRPCNTGVQIQKHPSLKIDWLEMTLKGVSPDVVICDYLLLGFDQFVESERGMQGYPCMMTYGKVKVLYDSVRDYRGTKIILSGQALDEVGQDAIEIIRLGVSAGASFARVDLALDDRSKFLSFDELETLVSTGYAVTSFSSYEIRKPRSTSDNSLLGRSIQWASSSSERMLIAYDKQLERIARGEDDPGHWIRFEGRWYKRAAKNLAVKLASGGLSIGGGLIRGLVDFRDKNTTRTDTRQAMQWWLDFTESPDLIRTGVKKKPTSIEQKLQWISEQVKKPLAQVASFFGPEMLNQIIRDGLEATSLAEWKRLDPLSIRANYVQYQTYSDLKTHFAGHPDCPF